MGQINFKANDETKLKLDWLTEVQDTTSSNIMRNAIDVAYEAQKAKYQDDQNFISWLKANR